jgi:hypothetical protein
MERRYGNEEYADMHFMYGKANGNALEAARLYQEAFPHQRQPTVSYSQGYINGSKNMGASHMEDGQVGLKALTPYVQERVLQRVAQSPGTSTRRTAAHERVLSGSSVW